MGTYTTSTGEKFTQTQIDYKIRKAKKKKIEQFMDEYGYTFCEDCKIFNTIIDCSHDISVDKCKKNGKLELAWDVNNITLRCRKCHEKHDKLNLKFNERNRISKKIH